MRRIVFSIGFSRQWSPALLVSKSTKSRWNFYKKIPRGSFHTAWVKTGKAQCEYMFSALLPKPDIARQRRLTAHKHLALNRNPAGCEQRPDVTRADDEGAFSVRVVFIPRYAVGRGRAIWASHSDAAVGQ